MGEQLRQVAQVNAVARLERNFTDSVLLTMVITTETDRPAIGRLEGNAAIRVPANMSAFDGSLRAAWHTAVVAAYPGAVSGALAAIGLARRFTLKPVREL